jgi:hypothetical protein
MRSKHLFLLLAACLCFFGSRAAVVRSGMVKGDAFEFARAAEGLPAGSYVQFRVTIENTGEKAPRHYRVEVFDGGEWVSDTGCDIVTIEPGVKHPTVFSHVFKLKHAVSDSLRFRCVVSSSKAVDGSTLDATDPENVTGHKGGHYTPWSITPLGTREPDRTAKILVIGNSFTYYYSAPVLLQQIAFSQGLLLREWISLKGGQSFRQHSALEMTGRMCDEGGFEYAFIQGQSQEPARYAADPEQYRDVREAYTELCFRVLRNSPGCRIFVETTWGYPGVSNGGFASLEEFDQRLIEGSSKLAAATGTERMPVGDAFTAARDKVSLLHKDDKHPGLAGAYLKACVAYLTMARRPFEGDVPSCGLPEETAAVLRSVAEKTVLR